MKMIDCPECGGKGQVEYEVPRPHAGGFNCGFIDTEWGECENCKGSGEIEADEWDEDYDQTQIHTANIVPC